MIRVTNTAETRELNRAQRRANGQYPSAGQGRKRRQAVSALNEALRTALRPQQPHNETQGR